MATFKVESKNEVDIDKKPRMYFTCHPDDFEKYFKKICDDIFKTHDCAIYYTEDMTDVIAEDDKPVYLGRHHLFVVPITFKLLTTPNRAMDEDIPYALKEHIPVLPIMMESGIDEFYSKPDKFGELQYLTPYSTDATEISYKEKLKKYLESVLISNELAKRVRAAFDAYIFLSYRKKDRKYANELMRLIHSNPECRDIAIWFDEFLTPGENFKENIEKILDDCKLFTLLVTPQLLEKVVNENGEEQDNYVLSTELPLARKKKQEKGTDIFAVEMEETDQEALSAINIDDYVNYDDAAFRTRLLEAVARMAITTNDTPEHNYLIGLAYLEGIDVEVDRERAMELITNAAESGLIEASDKLFRIYLNGIGVSRNMSMATKWISHSACLCSERFRADRTYDNLVAYITRLVWCAEHAEHNVGSFDESIKKYEDLKEFCEWAYKHFLDLQIKRQLGESCLKLAQLHHKKGNTDNFDFYAIEAIHYLETIRQEMEKELAKDIAAITLGELLDYYSLFGLVSGLCFTKAAQSALENDIESEEKYVKKGIEAAEYMANHIRGDQQVKLSLANAYCNAAKFYMRYNRWDEAGAILDNGHILAIEVGEITHSLLAGKLVVTFGMLKATLYLKTNRMEKALACLIDNMKGLESSSLTLSMKGTMALNYEKIVEMSLQLKNYQLCKETAGKCIHLYREILNNTDFVKAQRKLWRPIAISAAKLQEKDVAVHMAEKLIEVSYKEFSSMPSAKTALQYSESCYLLAEIRYETKDFLAALHTYKKSIFFSKTVMLTYHEVGDINLENTVAAHLAAAKCCIAMHKNSGAMSWMNKALAIRKRVYKANAESGAVQKLKDCYLDCAELLDQMKKNKKAQRHRKEAQGLSE